MSLTPKTGVEQPDRFTSALAHEIRNPLSNIRLAVQMLNAMITDDSQKSYLDIILRGSGRISQIVTELLASSEVEETQRKKYSMRQLLDETLAIVEDRITLKNITVSKAYAAKDRRILLNGQKMKIALTNIIINAIEAMPSEKGQLNLVTKSRNGKYVLEIGDNGAGISKENLKAIFKPYFTNKPGGMGLGLSTTLVILQSNHVKLDVKSEEGRGTRFILLFDIK